MNQITNLGSGPRERRSEPNDRSALTESPPVERRPFVPGDRVRVCRGLVAGAEGNVLKHCGENRSLIALDLRQRGVTLEVDDASLEPAE